MEIVDIGEKLHIIERRSFNEAVRRHFIGEVTRYSNIGIRVIGYAWVYDASKGIFERKPEKRERLIFPGDRPIVNIMPKEVNIEELRYVIVPGPGLIVTDGKDFSLDIKETD